MKKTLMMALGMFLMLCMYFLGKKIIQLVKEYIKKKREEQ